MRGLMVKDFKLLTMQKNFFLMIVVIALGMLMFTDGVTFPLGFLTFVASLFTLSTISYDEFDNGNAFLFTLPITRGGYVAEKYCFGLLLGFGAWVLAVVMAVTAAAVRGAASVTEIFQIGLFILPEMMMIQSIMIPFQIKFGAEKGRIAIIGGVAGVAVAGILAKKAAETMFHVQLADGWNQLSALGIGGLIGIAFAAAVLILLLSLKISVGIIEKKEF